MSIVLWYRIFFPWLQYGDNLRLFPKDWDLIICEAFAEHCLQSLVSYGS